MRRVVVTGMGIWSCIGQDLETVTESLRLGRSGIIYDPKRMEYGLQSGLVGNVPIPDLKPLLPRKVRATMSEDAKYAYMVARQAFEHAGIDDDYLNRNEIGIIWGNDGNSHLIEGAKIMEVAKSSLLFPYHYAFQSITSSAMLNLSSIFHLKGVNLGVSAACASSSHAIGIAKLFIESGMQDVIIVGGSSELAKENLMGVLNDAVNELYIYNNTPTQASRPFDMRRAGVISSGGAAALVIEDYDHAISRGATIYAEIIGYGVASGGVEELYQTNWESEYIAMKRAVDNAKIAISDIDYINPHANSSKIGDPAEAKALTMLAGKYKIPISSTESMTGHEGWMAGASEAVYSILMLQNNFVAPNLNLDQAIDEAKDLYIVDKTIYKDIQIVLSNNAGVGAISSALVFKKI